VTEGTEVTEVKEETEETEEETETQSEREDLKQRTSATIVIKLDTGMNLNMNVLIC
jgi:hypothetical protein